MASSPSSNKKQNVGLTEKQLRKIWSDMSPTILVDKLRSLQPSARWSASGSRLTGCCPYHDDRTPSFQVYLDRSYAKCFGCGQFVWNPVDFWSHVNGLSTTEALQDLKQTFSVSFITPSVTAQFSKWQRYQAMKTRLVNLAHSAMIDVLNNPDTSHPDMLATVKWLVNDRKLPMSALPTLDMLGVMPPIGIVFDALADDAKRENEARERASSASGKRVDAFISYEEEAREYLKQVTQHWVGSLLFRYDISPNSPGRIKLRKPQSREFIFLADEYLTEIGFFGLGWDQYNHLLGPKQRYLSGVHLVEGEFDALSLMGHQVEAFGGPRMVVVGAGGSSTASNVDTLYVAAGVEEVYLFGDAPDKNGDLLINQWLPNVNKLRAKVFCGWGNYPGAGDPDEAVLQYGIERVVQDVNNVQSKACYQAPQEWVLEKAAEELMQCDESDLRRRVEIATSWGAKLKNEVECDAFIEGCEKHYAVPASSLRRNIVALDEDEPAFSYRLANFLQKEFFVIGQQKSGSDRKLYLWHRKRKEVVQIILADERCIESEFGVYYGPLYNLFQKHLGIPPFMQAMIGTQDSGPWIPRFNKAACQQLSNALMHLAQEATDMSASKIKAQGIHVKKGPNPDIYVVNGRDLYYGRFSGDALVWEELEGPAHNGMIFDAGIETSDPPWMIYVKSVEDLNRAATIDLRDLYDRIYAILDLGWRFKHHQTAVQFMAAHLIAASVCSAFRRQTIVGIHAESASGKSKLLTGLIGGAGTPSLQILSAADTMSTYSPAGIRQHMANKTRPLALDEFEQGGNHDKKGRHVAEIQELFRNLTGEENTVHYGSRSGKAVVQSLNMFIFVAAITKPERVQDANRMVPIELMKVDYITDPWQNICRELGDQFIPQVRRDLEVALLPHVKKIQHAYDELTKHFVDDANRPKGIEPRFLEALRPAMTVMKIIGLDYQAFVNDFCSVREFEIVKTVEQSEAAQLMDWLLTSPQIPVRDEATNELTRSSVLAMLSSAKQRRKLNDLNTGAYYDESENLLVVNWTQAVQTVLRQHPRYGKEGSTYGMRDIANRHPTALRPLEIQQSGVIQRLKKHGVAAMGPHSLSVFRIGKVLRTFEVEENEPQSEGPTVTNLKQDNADDTPDFYGSMPSMRA